MDRCSYCNQPPTELHRSDCPILKGFVPLDVKLPAREFLRKPGGVVHVDAPAIARQEGGGHYKAMKIQPFEYIHANGIPFAEGCVIKYVSRWRVKGAGVEDLKKARHFLDLLIEAESK